jgi:hypothetical protein
MKELSNFLDKLIVVMGFMAVGIMVGFYTGRAVEQKDWVQAVELMDSTCIYAPQPITFPTGEVRLIKITELYK